MIDVLTEAELVLTGAHFYVRRGTSDGATVLVFEDDSLIGFVLDFATPQGLLEGWRPAESQVLLRYAPKLRDAGDKAWNVYSIFLTAEQADDVEERQVRWIEEDLERTRKISACGVITRDQMSQVFAPLLPLRNQTALEPVDFNSRLKGEIGNIASHAAQAILDDRVAIDDAVLLLEESL